MFRKSTFTYSCACRAEVAVNAESKFQSRNCKSYWNLKVFTRVPRLEPNYVSTYKLQTLYFVTGSFWRGLHCEGWTLSWAHSCEVPPKQNNFLMAKVAFDRHWKLQYWTLVVRPCHRPNDHNYSENNGWKWQCGLHGGSSDAEILCTSVRKKEGTTRVQARISTT